MATAAHNLLERPARLSGALIFNYLRLQGGQIDYNASADQQVSHLEMAVLEMVFAPARGWESLQLPTSAGAPEESANTTSLTP